MDRYYSQTIGSAVLTTTGIPVARIVEIVIDTDTGKVAGFLLSPRGQYVLATNDILFWDQHIFVHDEEDILETDEIIKVQDILKKNISILRKKVFTKNGRYLGKVYDIGINPKLFVLTKLAVAKNVLGLFPFDEKIIAHKNILEIKNDRIIVKDVDAKERVPEKARSAKENFQIDIAPSTFKDL